MSAPGTIENRTFDEIAVGDTASLTRTLSEADIQLSAPVSGDVDPAHLDPDYAATDVFHRIIAPSMWGGGLICALLGTELPGPGAVYLRQDLRFSRPVGLQEAITATVTVTEKRVDVIRLECACRNQDGQLVVAGEAEVKAPTVKGRRRRPALPDVRVSDHDGYDKLMGRTAGGTPLPTTVAHPCAAAAITAAAEAAEAGLIVPILVGPEGKIRAAAEAAGHDAAAFRLAPAPHSHAAAALAVALVRSGEAKLLMKGSLHTDELMSAVVSSASGLRTERRIALWAGGAPPTDSRAVTPTPS